MRGYNWDGDEEDTPTPIQRSKTNRNDPGPAEGNLAVGKPLQGCGPVTLTNAKRADANTPVNPAKHKLKIKLGNPGRPAQPADAATRQALKHTSHGDIVNQRQTDVCGKISNLSMVAVKAPASDAQWAATGKGLQQAKLSFTGKWTKAKMPTSEVLHAADAAPLVNEDTSTLDDSQLNSKLSSLQDNQQLTLNFHAKGQTDNATDHLATLAVNPAMPTAAEPCVGHSQDVVVSDYYPPVSYATAAFVAQTNDHEAMQHRCKGNLGGACTACEPHDHGFDLTSTTHAELDTGTAQLCAVMPPTDTETAQEPPAQPARLAEVAVIAAGSTHTTPLNIRRSFRLKLPIKKPQHPTATAHKNNTVASQHTAAAGDTQLYQHPLYAAAPGAGGAGSILMQTVANIHGLQPTAGNSATHNQHATALVVTAAPGLPLTCPEAPVRKHRGRPPKAATCAEPVDVPGTDKASASLEAQETLGLPGVAAVDLTCLSEPEQDVGASDAVEAGNGPPPTAVAVTTAVQGHPSSGWRKRLGKATKPAGQGKALTEAAAEAAETAPKSCSIDVTNRPTPLHIPSSIPSAAEVAQTNHTFPQTSRAATILPVDAAEQAGKRGRGRPKRSCVAAPAADVLVVDHHMSQSVQAVQAAAAAAVAKPADADQVDLVDLSSPGRPAAPVEIKQVEGSTNNQPILVAEKKVQAGPTASQPAAVPKGAVHDMFLTVAERKRRKQEQIDAERKLQVELQEQAQKQAGDDNLLSSQQGLAAQQLGSAPTGDAAAMTGKAAALTNPFFQARKRVSVDPSSVASRAATPCNVCRTGPALAPVHVTQHASQQPPPVHNEIEAPHHTVMPIKELSRQQLLTGMQAAIAELAVLRQGSGAYAVSDACKFSLLNPGANLPVSILQTQPTCQEIYQAGPDAGGLLQQLADWLSRRHTPVDELSDGPSKKDILSRLDEQLAQLRMLAHSSQPGKLLVPANAEGVLASQAGQLWVTKYAPQTVQQVCGNHESMQKLAAWLGSWRDAILQDTSAPAAGPSPAPRRGGRADSESEWFVSSMADSGWTGSALPGAGDAGLWHGLSTCCALAGPPGCGKTAAVYAAAQSAGFRVLEVHPGMDRNGQNLARTVGEALQSRRLAHKRDAGAADSRPAGKADLAHGATGRQAKRRVIGDAGSDEDSPQPKRTKARTDAKAPPPPMFAVKGKPGIPTIAKAKQPETEAVQDMPDARPSMLTLVLFDEADILADEDKGFLSTVAELIADSKRPIMLCMNSSVLPAPLQGLNVQILPLAKPSNDEILHTIALVAVAEGLEANISLAQLRQLVAASEGDIRHAMMSAQFWCHKQTTLSSEAVANCTPADSSNLLSEDAGTLARLPHCLDHSSIQGHSMAAQTCMLQPEQPVGTSTSALLAAECFLAQLCCASTSQQHLLQVWQQLPRKQLLLPDLPHTAAAPNTDPPTATPYTPTAAALPPCATPVMGPSTASAVAAGSQSHDNAGASELAPHVQFKGYLGQHAIPSLQETEATLPPLSPSKADAEAADQGTMADGAQESEVNASPHICALQRQQVLMEYLHAKMAAMASMLRAGWTLAVEVTSTRNKRGKRRQSTEAAASPIGFLLDTRSSEQSSLDQGPGPATNKHEELHPTWLGSQPNQHDDSDPSGNMSNAKSDAATPAGTGVIVSNPSPVAAARDQLVGATKPSGKKSRLARRSGPDFQEHIDAPASMTAAADMAVFDDNMDVPAPHCACPAEVPVLSEEANMPFPVSCSPAVEAMTAVHSQLNANPVATQGTASTVLNSDIASEVTRAGQPATDEAVDCDLNTASVLGLSAANHTPIIATPILTTTADTYQLLRPPPLHYNHQQPDIQHHPDCYSLASLDQLCSWLSDCAILGSQRDPLPSITGPRPCSQHITALLDSQLLLGQNAAFANTDHPLGCHARVKADAIRNDATASSYACIESLLLAEGLGLGSSEPAMPLTANSMLHHLCGEAVAKIATDVPRMASSVTISNNHPAASDITLRSCQPIGSPHGLPNALRNAAATSVVEMAPSANRACEQNASKLCEINNLLLHTSMQSAAHSRYDAVQRLSALAAICKSEASRKASQQKLAGRVRRVPRFHHYIHQYVNPSLSEEALATAEAFSQFKHLLA